MCLTVQINIMLSLYSGGSKGAPGRPRKLPIFSRFHAVFGANLINSYSRHPHLRVGTPSGKILDTPMLRAIGRPHRLNNNSCSSNVKQIQFIRSCYNLKQACQCALKILLVVIYRNSQQLQSVPSHRGLVKVKGNQFLFVGSRPLQN